MNKEHCARSGHVFAIGVDCGGLHVGKGFAEAYAVLDETVIVPYLFEEALRPTGKHPAARIELGPLSIDLSRFLVSEVPRRVWMDLGGSSMRAAATLIAQTDFDSGAELHPSPCREKGVFLVLIRDGDRAEFSIYARKVELIGPGKASLSEAFGKTTFLGRGGEGYCSQPAADPYIVEGESIAAEAVPEESWMCISENEIRMVQSWLIDLQQDLPDDGFTRF